MWGGSRRGDEGPVLLLAVEWLPIFRGPYVLEGLPRLEAYYRAIGNDPIAARLIGETRTALRRQLHGN